MAPNEVMTTCLEILMRMATITVQATKSIRIGVLPGTGLLLVDANVDTSCSSLPTFGAGLGVPLGAPTP